MLFAVSVVAWSATALTFGRIPALASAALLLRVSRLGDALPPGVERRGVRDRARALGARPARGRCAGPPTKRLRRARRRHRRARPDPSREPGTAPGGSRAAAGGCVAWRRRLAWVAACFAAAVLPLAGWAVHNGIRYDDVTVARGGRAWVPFLRVFIADRTIAAENGPASRRLAELIENNVLTREPFSEPRCAARRVPGERVELRDGQADRALRPGARARQQLRRALRLGGRGDPRSIRGRTRAASPTSFWEFLMQRPLRESVAPREQTAPEPPAPTFESDGVVLPNPQATVLARRRPVRVRLVRLGLHRLVHARRSVACLGRPGSPGALPRGRLARCAPGTPSFRRGPARRG